MADAAQVLGGCFNPRIEGKGRGAPSVRETGRILSGSYRRPQDQHRAEGAPDRTLSSLPTSSSPRRVARVDLAVRRATSAQSKRRMCSDASATSRSRRTSSLKDLLHHRRQRGRVAGAEAQADALAAGHDLAQPAGVGDDAGQPDAIASSATSPNGSYSDGITQRSEIA